MGTATEQRVSEFNSQGLANTAWALALSSQADEMLFTAMARTAERRIHPAIATELVSTTWAFAAVMQCDEKLFTVLSRRAELCVSEFDAKDLAQLLKTLRGKTRWDSGR
eukprot:gnl/TRDRNA2_/TRDRNA2_165604_c0_seq2.p1 gnl/TRDRNA2_/TRDRNA2_165604_c0~~gnl/TRDRNA2_/TRDRNA2_165604_c0_seq2.p1  ORF type:complete len:109 (+),score=17.23 gnl/TRDRNA2_/TRDRNA2_165604_c0_seq2:122-448(+)